MKAESEILTQARIALSRIPGCAVFRFNVGKLKDSKGRWVDFGPPPGFPDLAGWRSVVVTPEMVGQTLAVFLGVECKTEIGRLSTPQIAFRENLTRAGGFSIVYRGEPEVLRILSK